MDISFSEQDLQFQEEIRAGLSGDEYPSHLREKQEQGASLSKQDMIDFHKFIHNKGWMGYNWPVEHGGTGWSPVQIYLFLNELAAAQCPTILPFGLSMVGPVIYTFGNQEQKDRFLPDILEFNTWWCQGYSEPGSGSDLASLKTKAVLDGDHYIVNGSKTWTTLAQNADWIFCLVRTETTQKKQEGISFLLIDMNTPGIEVKPIKQISGGANFNEVYFTDVKIPDSQRLGAVGDGWKVSLTTLMNERLAVGDASGPDFQEAFSLARGQDLNGKLAIENDSVREKLADWYCQQSGLKYAKYRNISALSRGETPGPQSSITKIVSGNKLQEIANFGLDMLDSAGILRTDEEGAEQSMYQYGFYGAAGIRIAGGTDEILKNIISEQVLGMPQDMRADKGLPFNEIPTGNK